IECDSPCCHPRLFKKALQERGLWNKKRSPMIHKFCAEYKNWREAIALYLEISIDEAKLPWILKLSSEIVDGAHLLLACAEFAKYNVLYADRPSPVFSRIAAILSHMENTAVMILLDAVRTARITSEVLLFDGLLAKVVDCLGEAMVAVAVAEASAAAGVQFHIKSWQRVGQHVRFARAVLRGSQTVVVRRVHGERQVANCIVSVADWAQLSPKTALDEESATMTVKEFNDSELDLSQRDATKTPPFTKETVDNVFRRDNPEGTVYGAIETVHADAGLPTDGDDAYMMPAAGADDLFQPGPGLQRAVETREISSTLYDLHQTTEIAVRTWRCTNKTCRLTHGPNFMWLDGEKVNAATLADFEQPGVVSVRNQRAFTMRYLRYHEKLMFRAFTTARGIDWVTKEVFADKEEEGHGKEFVTDVRKIHLDALMYLIAAQEMEPIKEHRGIIIGKDITDDTFSKLDSYYHRNVFPDPRPKKITVLVGGGHEKVLTKCNDEERQQRAVRRRPAAMKGSMKRARKTAIKKHVLRAKPAAKKKAVVLKRPSAAPVRKRPSAAAPGQGPSAAAIRKKRQYKSSSKSARHMHHNHGWFMVLTPEGRIAAAVEQKNPEGNGVAAETLTRALKKHPNVNTFVYDRCCSFFVSAQKLPAFKDIKYWAVDMMHAKGHARSCPCNRYHIKRLSRRLKGINTQVAEQSFSWFRGYARPLNEMAPLRHKLCVLLFAKLHNNYVAEHNIEYLPPMGSLRTTQGTGGHYGCS
ncbi:unnamed protein product, partial [Prorocentrum cordatum]